ncbi:hypothetical protein LCGC14_2470850, partial [marine sediment metagenome]
EEDEAKAFEEEKGPLEGIDPTLETSITQKHQWGGEYSPEESEYMSEGPAFMDNMDRLLSDPEVKAFLAEKLRGMV